MSVTVTASNGWVHKPITEEDATAFIKSFNDYPLSPGDLPITYEERVNRFSECLLANNTGTLPLSSDNDDGVFRVYGIYKPDGTFVGQTTYGFFKPGEVWGLSITMHPDHRNQGYTMARTACCSGEGGLWDHYNINTIKTRLEASPTFPAMTALRTTWANAGVNIDAGDHTSSSGMLDASGNSVALKDLVATKTQAKAFLAANATWKDITCTIS